MSIMSPGPIYEANSNRFDYWRLARSLFAAGFRPGDLVQNYFSYHLMPAGIMLDNGCHALGCAVIPAGVGQTEMQVQAMTHLKPSGYVGTPSFLEIIIEKAAELNQNISSVSKALVSGESLAPSLRQKLSSRGISVLQTYATADLGAIAYETGIDAGLIIDEGVHVEIFRSGSGEPVADGDVGEVVVTNLNPDNPLIRFVTGDLSAMMEGKSACGRTNHRIRGWMGRADQTVKVRGIFIHPGQINEITKCYPEIAKAKLVVDWINQRDKITLQCEATHQSKSLENSIVQSIRDFCGVRAGVTFVEPGSIPNDGIVIEDIRIYD